MVSVRRFQVVLALVVALAFLSPTAVGSAASGPAIDRAGGHEDRIEVVLSTDGAPGPGGVATLTFEATPLADAPDLTVKWIVAEGAELLGDPAEAPQVVASGSTVTSQRQVRFPSTGTYKIIAAASYRPAESIQFVATGVLFFVIDERGSQATDRDPDARSPMHTIVPGSIATSPDRVEGPRAVEDDPCFTILGRLGRLDTIPTPVGHLPSSAWVRHAVIEVREEDLVFDDSYGDLLTDELGYFAGTFCDDDGLFDDTLEIYVRVRAEIRAEGRTVVEVEDNSWLESVYEFDSAVQSSGGGTLTFNLELNEAQSHIFNIADAIYEAWDFWNDSGGEQGGDAIFDEETEIQWQPGWGENVSHYDPDQEEINIADDPSDPDPWDDSVIIHEWGHFADDIYSCDDNPGGTHYSDALVDDPELSWSEGYPDYYQSAVRWANGHEFGEWYIDVRPGDESSFLNLETWDVDEPKLVSVLNEMAIAAALWDLYDSEPDGQDNVYHGPARIQDVYTSEVFQDIAYGFWDDTCDFDAYARAWVARGMPANKQTAAAIKKNTGYTLSPSSAMAELADTQDSSPASELTDAIWWDQLTYVVDNSQSMAGPKFDAVKTVLGETINDLEDAAQGTEFTLEIFNNTSLLNQEVFVGQFFGSQIGPAASSLSTSTATDSICRVHALRALNNAIADEYKGEAWLFTDGDTYVGGMLPVSVEGTINKFNNRQMHASIALLGVCPSAAAEVDPEEAAQAERLLRGAARPYVGAAADETPGGVVPYLLTAIGTGGQFLFVDESQMADAADVLRAQFTHSAGAGSWSDYVSDQPTYRWDNLTSWEYNWIDATAGTDRGNPATGSYITIPLPESFRYYGERGAYNEVNVFEDGYLTFGAQHVGNPNNTALPNPAAPNNAVYLFWDALAPKPAPTSLDAAGPSAGEIGRIYTRSGRNAFAIEYYQYQSFSSGSLQDNTFQVQLLAATDEIRYLYHTVPDGAASATIGLENRDASDAVQVSYNQGIGAANGTGYKFTPAPPQPTKTFSTTVDSLMSGVAFLLMGYSGSFERLQVQKPDGTQVNCHDVANVLCLDLGLVQYVQADVDRNYGVWKATVDAGPTGSGTFSFVSMAASELSPEFPGDHTLSTAGGTGLAANIGQPVDGDMLTGWFIKPDDTPFGPEFPMYDDGAHGDGAAGDGIYGALVTIPSAGRYEFKVATDDWSVNYPADNSWLDTTAADEVVILTLDTT
ncbi:MAG TPA: choice-of-anchor X domain-containing protein, partial [Anaerolineae bacterium]|nr:choice-of-anchor X domain-containing protein [Anaerolineae bacterium]